MPLNDHWLVNMKEQVQFISFLPISSVVLLVLPTIKVLEVVQLLLVLPGLVGGGHSVAGGRGGGLGVPEDSLLRSSSSYLHWIIALYIPSPTDLRVLPHRETVSVHTSSESWKREQSGRDFSFKTKSNINY